MNWIKWILLTGASIVMVLFQVLSYKRISKTNFKISLINILLIIIGGVIVALNTFNVNSSFRAFISFATIISIELLIFKDGISKTIAYGTICYAIIVISEIVLDVFLLVTKLVDLNAIDNNVLIKFVYSIALVLPLYFVSKFEWIRKIATKFNKLLKRSFVWNLLMIVGLTSIILLAFNNVRSVSSTSYIGNLILLISFLILIVIIYTKERRVEKEVENTKILLDFMAQYEKKIDEDRVNRHEMLNNLLILKSYEDKNSEKYNNTLNDIIDLYSKKGIGFKNINKLPSGLKGIIYYKINAIKNTKANISINISKQLSTALENMDYKLYAMLCKIVGITFDNAIEAAIKSKKKIINFDVYEDNNYVIIEIENSFSNKIDMKKINNKNYTTKGVNRGLGLYIVKSIIRTNKNISIKQEIIDKLFITKIQIKNLDVQ